VQIPILIERVARNGYRATSAEPFKVSARGATREEALAKLRAKIDGRLEKGKELVGLEIGPSPHPLAEFAGMFKDDPLFDSVVKTMAENRRRRNADPDVP
jgi:predicted RNase H-like HicB family nuclease